MDDEPSKYVLLSDLSELSDLAENQKVPTVVLINK